MYRIQGMYSDGSFVPGWQDESEASEFAVIEAAKKMLNDLCFEGDSVRVITVDGELVWDSSKE